MISAILGAPLWLQVLWFFAVSILTLCLTRPFAKKYVNSRAMPTNADMLIGKECVVTEAIDNVLGTGAVTVGGKVWTARTEEQGRDWQGHDRCENRGRQAHSKVKIFYY